MHVLIGGEVQGVFFRAQCAREARARGVAGFVRNLADGRVEAAFEGDEDAVDALVQWCHQGTEYAEVESVEVEGEDLKGDSDFGVR